MNEITLNKMQEDEAFGMFLIGTIGEIYGTREISLIKKYVYKYTDCGAWIEFDSEGILVGTIVEGSDAEYQERISLKDIHYDNDGAELLKKRFLTALENCEKFAEEVWNE